MDIPIETDILSKVPKIKIKDKNSTNELLNSLELEERNKWMENEGNLNFLYPSLNDPLFSKKVSKI